MSLSEPATGQPLSELVSDQAARAACHLVALGALAARHGVDIQPDVRDVMRQLFRVAIRVAVEGEEE